MELKCLRMVSVFVTPKRHQTTIRLQEEAEPECKFGNRILVRILFAFPLLDNGFITIRNQCFDQSIDDMVVAEREQ